MVTKIVRGIVSDPKVRFGKPVIEGTRVDVATILQSLAAGWTVEQVMAEYHVKREDVQAALAYAADVIEKSHPKPQRS